MRPAEFVGANERKRWPNIGNGERLLVLLPIYQQTNKPEAKAPAANTLVASFDGLIAALEGRRP